MRRRITSAFEPLLTQHPELRPWIERAKSNLVANPGNVLAHIDGEPPAPGERLYSAAFGGQACGTIVNAAASPDGGSDVLAVLQLAAAESGDVHLGASGGAPLRLSSLPYEVPAPAAPRGRIA